MPKSQLKKQAVESPEVEEKDSLKGTFISVMLIGGFIIITWIGVWALYLYR
ncbi:cytochrome c oxidase subunit 2A [Ornithinibacillus gellani]|uniref:cytochrome c oxidase subunit 2A n=1 Tax=Ornithinibacillus gellani TaxID=2293253 RepID=UPI000F47EB27|nr:cytochrome c oxidase subunit 2A [Ornithinibacillus gellani]TQS74375.1 cytochrome c oxidase subunit 2A [Ornithinibacillus gellani]